MAESKPAAEAPDPSIMLDTTPATEPPVPPTQAAVEPAVETSAPEQAMVPTPEPAPGLQTPPPGEPSSATEPPPASEKVKEPVPGLYDTVVVVDREQFKALMRNLAHGYTHDYYGLSLVTQTQRMFRVKKWEDAKELFNKFM